jgi:hypothetical protein
MSRKQLRQKLLINKAIQGRLLVRIGLYWFLYHGVLWMALFLLRYTEHRADMQAGALPRSFADLYQQFSREYFGIWVCAFAVAPIVLWDLLKFSHRIVGPIVRFKHTLDSLSAGKSVSQVRLREGDFLIDLQDTFNKYLATLQTFEPLDQEAVKSDLIEEALAAELRKLQAEVDAIKSPESEPQTTTHS